MVWGYPVLMYHKVGVEADNPGDHYLNISAVSFRSQMRVLARLGYRARPFCDIVEAVAQGRTLPRRTFAITFDDGYRCVGTQAAPILAEFRFPATVFVVSECVGKTNLWDRKTEHAQAALLNWQELGALCAAGWEIGGHSRSHVPLAQMEAVQARAEIQESKQATEAQLGHPLRTFCYPYGSCDARTAALARDAGFRGACTTRSGLAHLRHDAFLQPRVKVYHEGVLDLLYRVLLRPNLPTLRRKPDTRH